MDKFDPALKMKFLRREVLARPKERRRIGEKRGGEGDETERIETRNLNGLCPLFATTITRKESPGNFEGVRAIPIRDPFVRIGHWRAGVEKRARV